MSEFTGHFRARQLRMFGAAAAGEMPDTLSVYVIATDIRASNHTPAGLGEPALMRDSMLVVVRVAPVGTLPTPVTVRITLSAR
jgi:hypothetical protein